MKYRIFLTLLLTLFIPIFGKGENNFTFTRSFQDYQYSKRVTLVRNQILNKTKNRLMKHEAEILFEKLNLNMTVEDIIEILGTDYIDVGSGFPMLIYTYSDNYEIFIHGGFASYLKKIRRLSLKKDKKIILEISNDSYN